MRAETGPQNDASHRACDLPREIRILFINTEEFLGPPMRVHMQIMRHLSRDLYRVIVATNSRGDSATQFRRMDNVVTDVYPLGGTFQNVCGIWANARQLLISIPAIVSIFRVLWLIRREEIAVIHCTSEPRSLLLGFLVSLVSRTRLLVHVHVQHGHERLLRRIVVTLGLHRAAAVVAISQFVRQSVIRRGVNPSKVWAILNVVDLETFHPKTNGADTRREFDIEDDMPLIVTVGRVNWQKGQRDLLEALVEVKREFPRFKALILGWADPAKLASGKTYYDELQEFCAQHALVDDVIFGEARPDVSDIFAAADTIVVPSRWDEPLGLVVIEAMASGRPVIGTLSGGIPELITEETGVLVPRGNPKEMADAIIKLLRQPALRETLGRNARKRAERYFYESRLAEEIQQVYASLIQVPETTNNEPRSSAKYGQ